MITGKGGETLLVRPSAIDCLVVEPKSPSGLLVAQLNPVVS